MSLDRAHCSRCEYEEEFSHIFRIYKLDDNQDLIINETYAWCAVCNKVVSAEKIEDLSQMETKLEELLEKQSEEDPESLLDSLKFWDWWVDGQIALISWRQTRVSPPKCLDCGNTNIRLASQPDPDDLDVELVHPECGGTIAIEGIGVSTNAEWVFYTTEGDKISTFSASP